MSSSHESIQTVKNLLAYFREELLEAFEELNLEASEETEAYLVHLLKGFSRLNEQSSKEMGFDKPAAFYLGEAINSPGDRRLEAFRRLGDASLFNCGFFEAYISRRLVDAAYYQDVGRLAYQKLSHHLAHRSSGAGFQSVFEELASNFDGVVRAFNHLGRTLKGDGVPLSKDLLDQFDQQTTQQLKSLKAAGLNISGQGGEA